MSGMIKFAFLLALTRMKQGNLLIYLVNNYAVLEIDGSGYCQLQFDLPCATFRPLVDQLNFILVEEADSDLDLRSALQLVEDRTRSLRIEQDSVSEVFFRKF